MPSPPMTVPMAEVLDRYAEQDPDRTALVCGGEEVTYAELAGRAHAAAVAFRSRGVAHGDRVAIVLPNGVDHVVATFGAWKAGATPFPVASDLPRAELDSLLGLAGPALVVSGGPVADYAPLSPEEVPRRDPGGSVPATDGSQPWKVIGSGGSTGRPKLIVAGPEARVDPGSSQYMIEPGDVVLVPGPLHHQGPFIFTTSGLFLGNTVVLMERFDAAEVLGLIERRRVTWTYLVPTMTHRIWRLPAGERDARDLSSLRLVVSTGAPWATWLKEAWMDWLGPERILEMYGGTEEQGGLSITGTESRQHPGAIGQAHDDVRVLTAEGSPAPEGEVGELSFRASPAGGHTYVGLETERHTEWRSYGDLAYIRDGYVHLVDRRTDLIVSGGVNVYPAEVEGALEAHQAVRSAVVIGLPDADLGQRVHAVVEPEPDAAGTATEQELAEHLRERVARYKVPRGFEVVDGPLRDDTGKVRRSALREARVES